jgi:hypothetical protein
MKWRDALRLALRRAADKWAQEATAKAKEFRTPYERKARAVAKALRMPSGPVAYLHQDADGRPVSYATVEERQRLVALAAEAARGADLPFVVIEVRHQPGCPKLSAAANDCTCADPELRFVQAVK